jgi:hypothetical protein
MTTVGDTIEKVTNLQLKRAVMNELIEYLSQFIATDAVVPSKGIASPIGDFIPQNIVEEVRGDITIEMAKVEAQITKLKSTPISGEPTASKKVTEKVVKKAPPKRRN